MSRPFDRVCFQVEGLNLSRLVSAISKQYSVFDVKSGNKMVEFACKSKDKDKIIAIFEALCYHYTTIKENNAHTRVRLLLERIGLLMGALALVAATVVYPRFVTRVDYVGTSSKEVEAVVQSFGIREGIFAWNFDGSLAAEALRNTEGVAFASVTKIGTVVTVNVKEELHRAEYVQSHDTDMVSTARASVTRVVVYSGTALVKYGDVVERGETLIGAYALVGEEKVPSTASGEVYGVVAYELNLFYPDVKISVTDGATTSVKQVTFLDKTASAQVAPYERYKTAKTVVRNLFLIPFSVTTTTYTEQVSVQTEETATDEELEKRTYSALLGDTLPTSSIISKRATVTRAPDGRHVHAVIECETLISKA